MTSLSSSATTAVSDGNDDDTDEFWNPMVKLFLTNSAQEHKYDWLGVPCAQPSVLNLQL